MRSYRFEAFDTSGDTRTFRLFGPDGALVGTRELGGVAAFVREVEEGYGARSPDLPRLGRRLYEWLDGPTERWLEPMLQAPEGTAVHVDVAERLRHLPWELLARDGVFLCAHATRPFTPVRRVPGQARAVEAANRPLRVLFMACSPEGAGPVLDFEGEEAMILEATRGRSVELVVEESGTLRGLQEQMEWYGPGYFDVFHLNGHANVLDGRPVFWMEDELGRPLAAGVEEIAEAFSGNWPRLVFLSGCRTGQAPERGAVPSLAEALVQAGAPAVLGWGLPVGDVSASAAAATLYEHLAVGKPIDEAVARARRELLEQKSGFWHLLRLYADPTPLSPLVTPMRTRGREPLRVREAASEFLDAGSKVEICPRERFVGRRRTLQRCLRVLRSVQGEEDYAEGVLLHGTGGLGKSSLAGRLCDRMRDHRRVVLVGQVDEAAFVRTFSSKLDAQPAIEALQQPGLSLQQRLRRVLEVLGSTPYLFVFDDFERSLDETGAGYVLQTGARDVLPPLLAAIRETASASRAIVTSRYTFPLPKPVTLAQVGLESMRGAELEKKTSQLEAIAKAERNDPELATRVVEVSAGNPRLLHWLDRVLADASTDSEAILTALESTAEKFREDLLLERLLSQQEPSFRRFVALASVFDLPVPQAAVEAAAGAELAGRHLEHAVGLSLVERGHDPATDTARYFVSPLVRPLVASALQAGEVTAACARGASQLFTEWKAGRIPGTEDVLLEIHRLALASRQAEIAVEVAEFLAPWWHSRSRFRDAEAISRATLELGEDFRILHNLARALHRLGNSSDARRYYEQALRRAPEPALEEDAERITGVATIIHNLAGLLANEGEVARALELYQESLDWSEKIGDVRGKAATLHQMANIHVRQGEAERALELYQQSLNLEEKISNLSGRPPTLHAMANIYAQQGEVRRALELYQESLALWEKIGNVQGRAATLHQMANIHAQQGEVGRALELYQASLDLKEKIGNVQGKATTLASMSVLLSRGGDRVGAREKSHEAARLLAAVKAYPDLQIVLFNLSVDDERRAVSYLAQALWLALRVGVPAERLLTTARRLIETLGPGVPASPLLAGATTIHVVFRTERHPEQEALRQNASGLLASTAEAHEIAPEQFKDWVETERLLDAEHVIPRALRELEALVPEDEWVFDRALVAGA